MIHLEINRCLILNYFLPGNTPKTTEKYPWKILASLGMARHAWIHPTKSSRLTRYLFLVNISMQKIKDIHAFLPEILMIKESCNLIIGEHFGPFQQAITCSKLTIETLEQGVKYVQS